MATNNPISLDDMRLVEQGQKQLDQQATEERNKNMDRDLRKTGVMTNGPAEDVYDFAAAYDANTNFDTQPSGGVNYPNKFTSGLTVGGVDVKTGERLVSREDPDGFGKAAADGIGNSFTNSKTGQPAEDYDAMVFMAIEHLQNGGERNAFEGPYSPDMVNTSFDVAESIYGVREASDRIQRIIDDAPDELTEPNMGDLEAEEVTQVSMAQDATLQQSAEIIAQFKNFDINESEGVTEDLIEEMAFTVNNTFQMGALVLAYEKGDMDDQTALAYAYALDQYMKLSAFNMDSFQGGLLGVALDPLTYVSGAVGKLAYSFLGKRAGVRAVIDKLSKGAIGKMAQGAAAGAVPGAVEGGAIEGTREGLTQAVNQVEQGPGYDWDEIQNKTKFGAAAGGIIGVGFGGLLGGAFSGDARKGVVAAYTSVADNLSRHTTPLPGSPRAVRGSVGIPMPKPVSPPSALPPIPDTNTDFGIFMAGNSRNPNGYYTRLAVNVSERWGTHFPEGKSISGKQFLDVLDSWIKKPKQGIEAASGYEVDNSGLRYWVEGKIAAGERINKELVEDFLFVNEPVVNVNVSGINTDPSVPGQASYVGSASGATGIRNSITYDLFTERNFEMLPGTELTEQAKASQQLILAKTEDITEQLARYDAEFAMNDARAEMGLPALTPEKPTIDADFLAAEPEFAKSLQRYIDDTTSIVDNNELAPFPEAPEWQAPNEFKVSVRDKTTGEIKHYDNEILATRAMNSTLRQTFADIPTPKLIEIARKQDEAQYYGPVRFREMSFGGDKFDNNYREMRLYFGNDRRGNVQDLAMDRYGKPYDSLSASERKRIDAMPAMRADFGPVVEQKAHYPFEINRFGHVRMEDLTDVDGNSVLGVLELQSDAPRTAPAEMHPANQKFKAGAFDDAVQGFNDMAVEQYVPESLREDIVDAATTNRNDKVNSKDVDDFAAAFVDIAVDGGPMDGSLAAVRNRIRAEMGDEALENKALMDSIEQLYREAPPIRDANWEMVEGVDSMLVNRMLQYASENKYTKIMIPYDEASIERIEGWPAGAAKDHPKTVARYQQSMEILFDKKIRKRWGLNKLRRGVQGYQANGDSLGGNNEMWLIEFNSANAPKGRKALYSAGGPAYIAGERAQDDTEENP